MKVWFQIAILFLISITVYANTIAHEYTLDDKARISNSSIVNEGSYSKIFVSPTWPSNLYRPLSTLAYTFLFSLNEGDPLSFRIFSILMHSLTVLLIYALTLTLFDKEKAFLTALIFSIHPIHVEAVANSSNVSEIISAFGIIFGLLAVVLYFTERVKSRAVIMAMLFVSSFIAFYSKESGVSYFILLGLLFLVRPSAALQSKNKAMLVVLIPAVVFSSYIFNRYAVLGSLSPDLGVLNEINILYRKDFWERLLPALSLQGKYFGMLLIPWPQVDDYSYPYLPGDIDYPRLSIFILTLVVCLYSYRKKYIWHWCILWVYASLLIVSNIFIAIETIFALRLLYLGSVGFCLLLAVWIQQISNKQGRKLSTILTCAVFFLFTIEQNKVWKNPYILNKHSLEVAGTNGRKHISWAWHLVQEKKYDEAIMHLTIAHKLIPDYSSPAVSLAQVYTWKDSVSGALHWYKKALEIKPTDDKAMREMAMIYEIIGKHDLAKKYRSERLKVLVARSERTARKYPMMEYLVNKTVIGRIL